MPMTTVSGGDGSKRLGLQEMTSCNPCSPYMTKIKDNVLSVRVKHSIYFIIIALTSIIGTGSTDMELSRCVSEVVRDRGVIPKDHQKWAMGSNGHVIDDISRPSYVRLVTQIHIELRAK